MQIVLFIAGIALFLLAMQMLEQALGQIGSHSLRRALNSFTRTPLHGIVLGVVATAILQSSSVVGLMTLAFVGAGVIRLKNAIGIVLGSNLGTTMTGWLVTLLGFKLNLTEFSFPAMGLGALVMVISASASMRRHWGQMLFAFGLLLLGLSLMKDSVAFVTDYVDIAQLRSYSPWLFFVVGLLLAAVIQSSSAVMIIALAAVHGEIITLPLAAAMVIGADLGTTSTVMLGAIQGAVIKRQVAFVHFAFNLVTDLAALFCLPWLLQLASTVYGFSDPLFALVAIHSSFNLVGVVVFLPLAGQLEALAERLFDSEEPSLLVSKVSMDVPDAAFSALDQDTGRLLQTTVLLNGWRLRFSPDLKQQSAAKDLLDDSIEATYRQLKENENQLTDYILDLQRQPLSREQAAHAQQLLVCIRDTLFAAKSIKDIQQDLDSFLQNPDAKVWQPLAALFQQTETFYQQLMHSFAKPARVTIEDINRLAVQVESAHSQFDQAIYQLIDQREFEHEQASTAFNINRELLLSGHSLVNAMEHFFLPMEQARTLSTLIKLER